MVYDEEYWLHQIRKAEFRIQDARDMLALIQGTAGLSTRTRHTIRRAMMEEKLPLDNNKPADIAEFVRSKSDRDLLAYHHVGKKTIEEVRPWAEKFQEA